MTSTWTPLGIDSRATVRTAYGQVFPLSGTVASVSAGTNIAVTGGPTTPTVSLPSTLTGPLTVNGSLSTGSLFTSDVLTATVGVNSAGYVQAGTQLVVGGQIQTVSTADTLRTGCAGTPGTPVAVTLNGSGTGATATTGRRRGVVAATTSVAWPNGTAISIDVPVSYTISQESSALKTYCIRNNVSTDITVPVSGAWYNPGGGGRLLIQAVNNTGNAINNPVTVRVAWEVETWS